MASNIEIKVSNPHPDTAKDGALFWPLGRRELQLRFEILGDKIIARVVDIDAANGERVVFHAVILPTQKDRFVKAVRTGVEPKKIEPSNENKTGPAPEVTSDAVVIGDDPGNGTGHKLELPAPDA